jgi:hypothetical protein
VAAEVGQLDADLQDVSTTIENNVAEGRFFRQPIPHAERRE